MWGCSGPSVSCASLEGSGDLGGRPRSVVRLSQTECQAQPGDQGIGVGLPELLCTADCRDLRQLDGFGEPTGAAIRHRQSIKGIERFPVVLSQNPSPVSQIAFNDVNSLIEVLGLNQRYPPIPSDNQRG